jgi:hypothetical protein
MAKKPAMMKKAALFEKKDMAADKKMGIKENSKKDMKMDFKAMKSKKGY